MVLQNWEINEVLFEWFARIGRYEIFQSKISKRNREGLAHVLGYHFSKGLKLRLKLHQLGYYPKIIILMVESLRTITPKNPNKFMLIMKFSLREFIS